MDNKNKGLADNQDGEIILNESGTSISTGHAEDELDHKNEDKRTNDKNLSSNASINKSSAGNEEKDITD